MSEFPRFAAFGSATDHKDADVLHVENVRYTVPTHYTSGDEFATLAEAVEHAEKIARTPVRADWAGEGKHPRVFVDRRGLVHFADGGRADMVLDRIEVFV